MPDLTKEQLAEGRRLLEAWQNKLSGGASAYDVLRAQDAWYFWLQERGAAMFLSAAEAKASAAEFAGACVQAIAARRDIWERGAIDLVGDSPDAAKRCEVRAEILEKDALRAIYDLAAQRGIELTATPAGEAEDGEA